MFLLLYINQVSLRNNFEFLKFFLKYGPGDSVGRATDYGLDGPGWNPGEDEIFSRLDLPWGPPSLLYNGYQVFSGGKERPGRVADHSPPSSAAVMEE